MIGDVARHRCGIQNWTNKLVLYALANTVTASVQFGFMHFSWNWLHFFKISMLCRFCGWIYIGYKIVSMRPNKEHKIDICIVSNREIEVRKNRFYWIEKRIGFEWGWSIALISISPWLLCVKCIAVGIWLDIVPQTSISYKMIGKTATERCIENSI